MTKFICPRRVGPDFRHGSLYPLCTPEVLFSLVMNLHMIFRTKDLPSPHGSIGRITVTTHGVYKLLDGINIKVHKATGPDGIPGHLLKELASDLASIFTTLYQASSDWKMAFVMPIFKKGNRNTVENYRPVSLTSICCKLAEHNIHCNAMRHLEELRILTDSQHGFRKHCSCETQLILTIDDLSRSLDNSEQVDAILLDFSKAFDKVPHRHLLYKLNYYGIRGARNQWIASLLTGRMQSVVVEGQILHTISVTSGVPQGSVLGPLLFLLYINDLPECVSSQSTVRLFADDSFLYRKIRSTADSIQLQHDLDQLAVWEQSWLMSFNPSKCQLLRITKKRSPIQHDYTLRGHVLEHVHVI